MRFGVAAAALQHSRPDGQIDAVKWSYRPPAARWTFAASFPPFREFDKRRDWQDSSAGECPVRRHRAIRAITRELAKRAGRSRCQLEGPPCSSPTIFASTM